MQLNRNHYFMAGLLTLLLGLQFRQVESFVLNDKVTRFLAERLPANNESSMLDFYPSSAPIRKVVKPPSWLGWSLISIGSVLILHSLAMRKPGG
ncbi:MAG TPA: hypothetical protein VFE24_16070 [Pirellulales bacterium]|nr:hypothetical protein [Pirellulales bacterium]